MISRLHLVTDDRVLGDPGFTSMAEAVLVSGSGRVSLHLRGPRTSARRLWELGVVLRQTTRDRDVPLIVNDRLDLALALPASGTQLGIRSLPAPTARRMLGPHALIGCSIHDAGEAEALVGSRDQGSGSPDFVLVGTLFPSPSHSSRTPAGEGLISCIRNILPTVPVLGIGGVREDRVSEVVAAGAHGIAVIRAVWDAPDPPDAVGSLLERLESCGSPGIAGDANSE